MGGGVWQGDKDHSAQRWFMPHRQYAGLGSQPGTEDRKIIIPAWTSKLLPASDEAGFSLPS